MTPSLEERLNQIRDSPKLQSQHQNNLVLSAVEDTLRTQGTPFTPAAYFSALLGLLSQYISSNGIVNKDVATAIVYLLDLITPHVSPPLLRSKFIPILSKLAVVLTHPAAEAPLLRSSIGCLESLLVIQDAEAWSLPQVQISPRRAVAGLLTIATDHRPKVRKRAQEAILNILSNPPPSPSLDHPAADLCAEFALRALQQAMEQLQKTSKKHQKDPNTTQASLVHHLQLIKAISSASGGWPSRKLDPLCELLLSIAKSSNEYLTMTSFEIFESMFAAMADEKFSSKLPHLMEILEKLEPSAKDTQLMPPWIAILSRAFDVTSQISPQEAFAQLPHIFTKISSLMSSDSPNIRLSASECLISFLTNGIPDSVILDPSLDDKKVISNLVTLISNLLTIKYQAGWKQVFEVIASFFEDLRWRSESFMSEILKIIGQLRVTESFAGKAEADLVISQAIKYMGPESVLKTLPLNLLTGTSEPGRVWLLPLMRNAVLNTRLGHFKHHLLPLSEKVYQIIHAHGTVEKSMEIKIYETILYQIWATLPGYCTLPIDLKEAFDQPFAEVCSNILYQQVDLRTDVCKALQKLVDTNKALLTLDDNDPSIALMRVFKSEAGENLKHLEQFADNLLAVLFNVYSQTLPVSRVPILQCINSYLSITPESDLVQTFERVTVMLNSAISEAKAQPKSESIKSKQMPPMSHTLMDLVITLTPYLPRASLSQLFALAISFLNEDDAALQKKAYKIIPHLSGSETGRQALAERNEELQKLTISTSHKILPSSRKDRLISISKIIDYVPQTDLSFIPSVVPEVVLCTKDNNERTRNAAFDLLISMAEKMIKGGMIDNSKVPHMSADAPAVKATLEEYFTMVSAGLAGAAPSTVSSTIIALTRIFFQYHQSLSEDTISELVQTMDIFLTSPNREIVRAVLGFVKGSIISLPINLVRPKLNSLIPHLIRWNHEHKGQLQAKVKHIFERLVRRFGAEEIEKHTPESDRKLITNIRKSRDRAKRKKKVAGTEDERTKARQTHGSKLASGLDQALYGNDDDDDDSMSDTSEEEEEESAGQSQTKKNNKSNAFIIEDENEPLDLLDQRVLGHISSTLPLKKSKLVMAKHKAKVDLEGKLVFAPNLNTETSLDSQDEPARDNSINAYVQALRADGAAKRNPKGKVKFSNKPKHHQEGENNSDDDAMQIDGEESIIRNRGSNYASKKDSRPKSRTSARTDRASNPLHTAKAGMKIARQQRRGLGQDKSRGGRIIKATRS